MCVPGACSRRTSQPTRRRADHPGAFNTRKVRTFDEARHPETAKSRHIAREPKYTNTVLIKGADAGACRRVAAPKHTERRIGILSIEAKHTALVGRIAVANDAIRRRPSNSHYARSPWHPRWTKRINTTPLSKNAGPGVYYCETERRPLTTEPEHPGSTVSVSGGAAHSSNTITLIRASRSDDPGTSLGTGLDRSIPP